MMAERVLSFAEALAEVLLHAQNTPPAAKERHHALLAEALGRVLAGELRADRDQPPFARSTRDGYAVYSGDKAWNQGAFRLIGSVRAGEVWRGEDLGAGETIEIMTGAPVPGGSDAVLMVEHARLDANEVRPEANRRLGPGENVVPQGAEVRAFEAILPKGRVLGAAEIAVAASAGYKQLPVYPRPAVTIVATGDELVDLDTPPEAWQIRNSNSYALQALVQAEGGEPQRLPIARDTVADLGERMEQARGGDLMLLSGGVSMGKYDFVEQVLRDAGAEFIFTGALIQPGKPVVFGRLPKRDAGADTDAHEWTYFFGLPGNPISTQVCFHLFVAPMLRALGGRTELAPQFVEARLVGEANGGTRVTRFLPAELTGAWDGVTVRIVGWQGSGDVAANARGNCYAVLPSGVDAFHAGDTVRVLLR